MTLSNIISRLNEIIAEGIHADDIALYSITLAALTIIEAGWWEWTGTYSEIVYRDNDNNEYVYLDLNDYQYLLA